MSEQTATPHTATEQSHAKQWYEVKETRNNLGLAIMFFFVKLLPAVVLRVLAFPVGFFYFLFAKKARAFSKQYLRRVQTVKATNGERFKISTLRHIVSFALVLTEKVGVWAGKIVFKSVRFEGDDVHEMRQRIAQKQGCLLIISHLGNSELLRALVDHNETGLHDAFTVNVVYDTQISGGFTSLLNKVDSHAAFNIIDANNITPQTIGTMQERLAAGECVAIAGDRTSAHTNRFVTVPFLQQPAHFSYGTFLLVALLNVPTYFLFGMRHKDVTAFPTYKMLAYKNPVSFDCTRKEREERIVQTARHFATALEKHCLEHPYQWYNFFDFWAGAE